MSSEDFSILKSMNIIDSYKPIVLQAVDNFIDLKSIVKDKEKKSYSHLTIQMNQQESV